MPQNSYYRMMGIVLACLFLAGPGYAQDRAADPWNGEDALFFGGAGPSSAPATPEELEELTAPIALYPDPLLAQILAAATYPTNVVLAARWVRAHPDPAGLEEQPWDESVRAVAHYPEIIRMMDERLEWTQALGEAFLKQPGEVLEAIQRLRFRARALGNLESTPEQLVIVEQEVIRIVPAQPQLLYIPQYDPQQVYSVHPYLPAYPLVTPGPGLWIGPWLALDFNWQRRHLFFHGWDHPGWVHRSRPFIVIKIKDRDKQRYHFGKPQPWKHQRRFDRPFRDRPFPEERRPPERPRPEGTARPPVFQDERLEPRRGKVFEDLDRGSAVQKFDQRGRRSRESLPPGTEPLRTPVPPRTAPPRPPLPTRPETRGAPEPRGKPVPDPGQFRPPTGSPKPESGPRERRPEVRPPRTEIVRPPAPARPESGGTGPRGKQGMDSGGPRPRPEGGTGRGGQGDTRGRSDGQGRPAR